MKKQRQEFRPPYKPVDMQEVNMIKRALRPSMPRGYRVISGDVSLWMDGANRTRHCIVIVPSTQWED